MKRSAPSPRSEVTPGRVRTTLRSFIHSDSGSAGLLVAATLLALIVANSPLSEIYQDLWGTRFAVSLAGHGLDMDLHHWVNDGLMVIFFFTIGLEVRQEFSVGELTDRRRLVVPLLAGLGGMLIPAGLYLAINHSGEASAGWGTVIGTDTAFLLGMLALVGPAVSSQLRVFLLTVTVVDDIVAVSVIGIAYTEQIVWVPLLIAVAALIGMVILDRLDAWRAGPYVALVVIAWLATIGSGLHASIAGMLAGLLVPAALPTRKRVEAAAQQFRLFRQSPLSVTQRQARDELTRTISVNERLQASLQTVTSFVIVPIFAFANAGVDLRGGVLLDALTSPVTWGVVVALVLGKALGISLGAFAALKFGWGRLPQGVRGGHLVGGATLSGIGFTVSLLIADLAFSHEELRRDAIIGILLAAVTASLLGWLVFTFAARVLGQRDAALPTTLSEPVDPDRDHIRGPVDARLTLVEYLDFECPFCARTTGAAREVREHFGDRLRYVVRHFPLDEIHPHSELAALGAEAAGRQGRFWDMHDLLFANQHELELENLAGYAGELGLNVEAFLEDLNDDDLATRLAQDRRSGGASGVRGTPTFFIGERRHEGRFDSAALIEALEESARLGGAR